MVRVRTRDSFYLWLALAMTATAFIGFWFTYFGPVFRRAYPEVSPLVHVHGWTFFAWYLLLPVQAGLVRTGRVAAHRAIGLTSIALGALMIGVGLIVSVVQIDMALRPDAAPFWQLMGLPIFSIWILFTVFYIAAIRLRRRPADHKRLIMLASAAALGAATFRILVRIFGFAPWVAVAGCLAPVSFILVAMVHEYRQRHSVSPAYLLGSAAMTVLIGGAFLLVMTRRATFVQESVGWVGQMLRPLY